MPSTGQYFSGRTIHIEENACQVDLIDVLLQDNVFGDVNRSDVKNVLTSHLFSFITNDINLICSCDYVLSLLPSDDINEYSSYHLLQNRIDDLKNLSVIDTNEFSSKQLQIAINHIEYFSHMELSESVV